MTEKGEWDELFGYLEENPAPPAEDQIEDDCCVEVAKPYGTMGEKFPKEKDFWQTQYEEQQQQAGGGKFCV